MGFLDELGAGLRAGGLSAAAGMSNAVFQEQGQAIARRKDYEYNRQAKAAETMLMAAHSGQIPDEHLPEVQQALSKMGYDIPLVALTPTPDAREKLSEYARVKSERTRMETAGMDLANYGQPGQASSGLGMPGPQGLQGSDPTPRPAASQGLQLPMPPRPQGMPPDQGANPPGVQTFPMQTTDTPKATPIQFGAPSNTLAQPVDKMAVAPARSSKDDETNIDLRKKMMEAGIDTPHINAMIDNYSAEELYAWIDNNSRKQQPAPPRVTPPAIEPAAPDGAMKETGAGQYVSTPVVTFEGRLKPRGTIPPIVQDAPADAAQVLPPTAPDASHPVISQAIPPDTSHENLMDWYRRAVLATQRGVPGAKEVLAHVMKLLDPTRVDYLNVAPGNSVYDPRTGKLVFQSQPKDAIPPEIIKLMNARDAMASADPNDPRLAKLDQVIAEYKGTGVTTNVNVDTKGPDSFAKELYKGQADIFNKGYDAAKTAAQGLPALLEAKSLLDQGIVSGNFANMKLQLAKVFNKEKAANTEAYISTVGRQVAALVRQIGGTQISDGDRKYAMLVAGGEITLNEESMRKIIDIGERASNALIEEHNQRAGQIESSQYGKDLPYSLKITAPDWNSPAAKSKSGAGAPTATLNVTPKVNQSTRPAVSGTAAGFAPPKDAPAGTKFYGYSPDGQRVWKLPDGSMATE